MTLQKDLCTKQLPSYLLTHLFCDGELKIKDEGRHLPSFSTLWLDYFSLCFILFMLTFYYRKNIKQGACLLIFLKVPHKCMGSVG